MNETEKEHHSSSPSGRDRGDAQIFLCDASAEAGRLLNALQSKGYAIVDVPLGLLPNRTLYEIPKVLICDADAKETPRRLQEMRDAIGDQIKIILVGQPEGIGSRVPELREWATEFYERPIDIDAVVASLTVLVGAPRRRSHRPLLSGSHRAPTLVASARKPYRSDGRRTSPLSSRRPLNESSESQWPVDSPPSRGPTPSDGPRPRIESSSARSSLIPSSHPPSSNRLVLSAETQGVLDEGRKKLDSYPQSQSSRPVRLPMVAQSAGDEIRSEFLLALQERLDDGEIESELPHKATPQTSSGTADGRTPIPGNPKLTLPSSWPPAAQSEQAVSEAQLRATRRPQRPDSEPPPEEDRTNPGGKPATQPPAADLSLDAPAPDSSYPLASPLPLDDLSDLLIPSEPERHHLNDDGYSLNTPPQTRRQEPPSQPTSIPLSAPALSAPSLPVPLVAEPTTPAPSEVDPPPNSKLWIPAPALEGLAVAIRERRSGAIAQQDAGGIRRIVLTDGDISTVASSIEKESLAAFLHERGDYSREVLGHLGAIPAFGRHAGAALIARGYLQQEELWPVLRAHAEWILGNAVLSDEPTQLEVTVPARLAEEPAVFGGAAGTEIYLEAVRRVFSPEQAFHRLGSGELILGHGRYKNLMGEAAIPNEEQQRALSVVGRPLETFYSRHPDMLPLLLAFCQLGVLSAGGDTSQVRQPDHRLRNREIDEEAFLTRLNARSALIEEGDYFTILGVTRSASSYEIDRAHGELLREYADEKLTPRTLHLREDLALIRETIDEAHLVLRDDVRRQRYRAALEALPG